MNSIRIIATFALVAAVTLGTASVFTVLTSGCAGQAPAPADNGGAGSPTPAAPTRPFPLALAPSSGPVAGGTIVAITSASPVFGAGTAVLFGSSPSPAVSVINQTVLTAVVPPGDPGAVTVSVMDDQGEAGTITDGFTYVSAAVPAAVSLSIVSVSPNIGSIHGGTEITVTGTGLTEDTAVLFDGLASSQVTFISSVVVVAVTPTHAAGAVNVALLQSSGASVTLSDAFTYTDTEEDVTPPRVVGAVAVNNTTVVVTFSEPVGEGAEVPAHYAIVGAAGSSAAIVVRDAILDVDGMSVTLITLPLNEITYVLRVTDVRDRAGNQLAAPDRYTNPSETTFAGVPPTIGGGGGGGSTAATDSDGDGLSDKEEQQGWVVTVSLSNGTITERNVTSDPFTEDSDGDGLTDLEEQHLTLDPRDDDTDADMLSDADEYLVWYSSPSEQDTDDDGLTDSGEILFFKTSALLADTDGDAFPDSVEIETANRDPRISDLPVPRIKIGNVNLVLDARFTYTDTQGESRQTTESTTAKLSQSDTETFSTSDEDSTKATAEVSEKLGVAVKFPSGGSISGEVGITAGLEHGHTSTFTEGSSSTAEQAFEDSLTTSATVDISRSVTREVVGANVLLDVTVQNIGSTAFTIDNLEVTALQQDARDRKRFIPIASLIPQNANLGPINLGPLGLVAERGPIVFQAVQVFPDQVEDLLKSPRGVICKLANFDITDEFGRNFAFTSQEVFDRTAGITIDYGNGLVDSYRVATNGRFSPDGRPEGISMGYALQDILGLTMSDVIRDGGNGIAETFVAGDDIQVVPVGPVIRDGGNGIAETTAVNDDVQVLAVGAVIRDGGDGVADTVAAGDDIQVVPVGDPVTPGDAIVTGGPDGFLDTTAAGDDKTGGFVTQHAIAIAAGLDGVLDTVPTGDDVIGTAVDAGGIVIKAGPNQMVDSTAGGDDMLGGAGYETTLVDRTINGLPAEVEILTRIEDVKSGFMDDPLTPFPNSIDRVFDETRTFWVIFSSHGLDPAVNFNDIRLRSGDQFSLTFVQDKDGDGVYAREEYLYGSSDSNPNTDGCPDDDLSTPQQDGTCTAGTFDTLTDYEEIREGWMVAVEGQLPRHVYPDPVQPDSDGDQLLDDEERDCGLDPRQRDSDVDGLTDFEELNGYEITDQGGIVLVTNVVAYVGDAILDGGDGILGSARSGDDVLKIPGANVTPGGVLITPGPNGTFESTVGGDDFVAVTHRQACQPFATDPLNADTDGDGITDGSEVKLHIHPNNPLDGAQYRDADRDGVPDATELNGFTALVNGVPVLMRSNPFEPDTDGDRLPDLLEHMLGSDPNNIDTDGDGLEDFDEFNAGNTCVDTSEPCTLFDDYADFLDECFAAEECSFVTDDLNTYGSARYGTNLNDRDTDGDTLDDNFELNVGWTVTVGGSVTPVLPSPFMRNSDNDGWDDATERSRHTDPNNDDTDGDGVNDDVEAATCADYGGCRNPLQPDQKITVTYVTLSVGPNDCDTGGNSGEYAFNFEVRRPGQLNASSVTNSLDYANARDDTVSINSNGTLTMNRSVSFIMDISGEDFRIEGWLQEVDFDFFGCGCVGSCACANETYDFGETYSGVQTSRDIFFDGGPGCLGDDVIAVRVDVD